VVDALVGVAVGVGRGVAVKVGRGVFVSIGSAVGRGVLVAVCDGTGVGVAIWLDSGDEDRQAMANTRREAARMGASMIFTIAKWQPAGPKLAYLHLFLQKFWTLFQL